MPLPLPTLDSRTFAELVAEGEAMLPLLAPTWTDYNVHDPGITLIELFAWLTEMDIFRLDRTTDESRRAFLRLIGFEMKPAQVAGTVVVFTPDPPSALPLLIPPGTRLTDHAGDIFFATERDLYISAAQIVAVFAGARTPQGDVLALNPPDLRFYPPFGSQAQSGSALYLGFDKPLADAGTEISLHVWTSSPDEDRQTREQLIAESQAIEAESGKGCVPPWWEHYSVRTVWEYSAPGGKWMPLQNVVDETRALTLSGPVRFAAPADHAADGHYWIRCRLVAGSYECPPVIDGIALNAVTARNDANVDQEKPVMSNVISGEPAGRSNGNAGQVFALSSIPVLAGSTRLLVFIDGKDDEPWSEAMTWDLAGPHDRVYVLTPETGEIAFGNGRAGRVPPAGAEIYCTYRAGGGVEGNVPAGTLVVAKLNGASPGVWQPFAATGGAAAETLADAQARALSIEAPARAVTLSDFETLALMTPGVPVAKARALAEYHPAAPCFTAPGCVTVIVIPQCPDPAREINKDLLRAVERYLGRRRTVATEVHVIGPEYTGVVVSARLHVRAGTPVAATQQSALAALAGFFDPLLGGPDKQGWPAGRDVFRSEVMTLLAGLPGVVFVDGFGLQADGDREPRCGNLPICQNHIIASGAHQIQVVERKSTS